MAINTATKRQSACSFGQVYDPLNLPDGTIDQGDRQAVCFAYSGVLAQTLTASTGASVNNDIWIFFDD